MVDNVLLGVDLLAVGDDKADSHLRGQERAISAAGVNRGCCVPQTGQDCQDCKDKTLATEGCLLGI